MRRPFLAAIAVLAVTGAATARDSRDDLAKALDGRVAGTPVRCIQLSRVNGPQIVDRTTILYRDGGRLWRTGPRGACPSLRPLTALVTEVYGGQLCRNDRFRILAPGDIIASGTCLFTDFTPYDRPPR